MTRTFFTRRMSRPIERLLFAVILAGPGGAGDDALEPGPPVDLRPARRRFGVVRPPGGGFDTYLDRRSGLFPPTLRRLPPIPPLGRRRRAVSPGYPMPIGFLRPRPHRLHRPPIPPAGRRRRLRLRPRLFPQQAHPTGRRQYRRGAPRWKSCGRRTASRWRIPAPSKRFEGCSVGRGPAPTGSGGPPSATATCSMMFSKPWTATAEPMTPPCSIPRNGGGTPSCSMTSGGRAGRLTTGR